MICSHLFGTRGDDKPCKWLVCMTTTPERLTSNFLFQVLDALLTQKNSCSFKIILFLPYRSTRTRELYPDPGFLQEKYSEETLAIHRCEDMGPATKFTGLLSYRPLIKDDVTHVCRSDRGA